MMKRLFAAVLSLCFVMSAGCSKKKEVDPTVPDHEWTEQEAIDSIGGVVEGNVPAMIDYLRLLNRLYFCFEGYVIDVNPYNHTIIDVADKKDGHSTTFTVYSAEPFEKGDYVYVSATINDIYSTPEEIEKSYLGYMFEANNNNKKDHCSKQAQKDCDYKSVYSTKRSIEEIYNDTTIKTRGVVYKSEGKFYLYPNAESKKKDKYMRIELILADDADTIVGKEVEVIGCPAIDDYFVSMWNVYLSEED